MNKEEFGYLSNGLDSTTSSESELTPQSHGWLKLGVVAAASALAGGLAAAWWYRKTLSKLREAEEVVPHRGIAAIEDEQQDDA